MKSDFKNTLLVPFENGLLDAPGRGERWGIFNGHLLPENPYFKPGQKSAVKFEQGFRTEFNALSNAGYDVVPTFGKDDRFSHGIVFAGRSRKNNELDFQRAWERVEHGGNVIVVGEKTSGVVSLRKRIGQQIAISESISKFHAVCFWCQKQGDGFALDAGFLNANSRSTFADGEPDKGSQLLTKFFDQRIKGKVADFGAGSGFLTRQLVENCPKIENLDLYEADWHSLEEARRNLANIQIPLAFNWIDLVSEFRKRPYEWIIMNPPFHHGLFGSRAADPNLGKAFIRIAASSLVSGGKLLMVANRNLPYEETLQQVFRNSVKLADESGYKIFEATK